MSRRATIRTTHDDPELVARALCPDNTDEMETVVDGDAVVTRIDRETTGGLHSNVDDYVVNLEVAMEVTERTRAGQDEQPTDTGPVSDSDSDTSTHNE
ncbi:KEOPS complex Pcc1-like subunit [Natronorubrum sp. JWXQ-INN-674]|uniref:KEOPS complex Pcc1-like subunit n=1 Tax=Natronorubrum halalkaliphilum TaxID=2691917 RepID=A0A6B0VL98_9EURY|nr:KEOPS complex subunit Pcc1 [Natronorubrum halalkaliphilum]MXV62340.1 KEOPS complex Pcc1-like subunit [Natronorubrum halalkaliphilum]